MAKKAQTRTIPDLTQSDGKKLYLKQPTNQSTSQDPPAKTGYYLSYMLEKLPV